MDTQRIVLIDHSPKWRVVFEQESEILNEVLRGCLTSLHHVGSSSVPGLISTPVIDICGEVNDLAGFETFRPALEAQGYVFKGEFGVKGRRYFTKRNPEHDNPHMMEDLVHLNVFRKGAKEVDEYMLFRDYLRAHPEAIHDYNQLKLSLQHRHKNDRMQYQQGKTPFIQSIIAAGKLDQAG